VFAPVTSRAELVTRQLKIYTFSSVHEFPHTGLPCASACVGLVFEFIFLLPLRLVFFRLQAFMRHERGEQKRRAKEGAGAAAAAGLEMSALVAEFAALGVGLGPAEAAAFLAEFDTNGDGRMSIAEFTQVIAAAKRKETKKK